MLGSGAGTGTGSIQDFMSPFQQQVIDTTLGEFDRQRQIQEQAIKDQQAQLGVLGAGRAGVQLSEFGSEAARQKALLQAGLQQQGFQDAVARRQQDIANRQGLAQSRLGVGQAELGLNIQSGLGSQVPGLQRADIQTLGQVGAAQQAQAQAQLDASREAARMAAFEPQERLGFLGQGVTGLMGGYPVRTTTTNIPNPTPLQTALGVGSTLEVYRTVTGKSNPLNLKINMMKRILKRPMFKMGGDVENVGIMDGMRNRYQTPEGDPVGSPRDERLQRRLQMINAFHQDQTLINF